MAKKKPGVKPGVNTKRNIQAASKRQTARMGPAGVNAAEATSRRAAEKRIKRQRGANIIRGLPQNAPPPGGGGGGQRTNVRRRVNRMIGSGDQG